jgi:LPS-assembly protein
MMKPCALLCLFLCVLAVAAADAQSPARETDDEVHISSVSGATVEYDVATGFGTATNGILVQYGGAWLIAQQVRVDNNTGEVEAEGNVRIQRDDMIWVGERIRYNFKTRQMLAEQFRAGKRPVYFTGEGLHVDLTNRMQAPTNAAPAGKAASAHSMSKSQVMQSVPASYATNSMVTTDDSSHPFQKVRAKRIRIVPGKYVIVDGAVFYLGDVPVFYLPTYKQRLDGEGNHFGLQPGYRSAYGAYLLGSYLWRYSENLETTLHLDYRSKRGVGAGADASGDFGRWGRFDIQGYWVNDQKPESDNYGNPYPRERGLVQMTYQAEPGTNFTTKGRFAYESDAGVTKTYRETLYRQDPEPSTFIDFNKLWRNYSLEFYAQPRVVDFYETVERLPMVRLTGYRQQIGEIPLYYENDSSFSYNRREYAITNGIAGGQDFEGARADTYHQIVSPQMLFGWLNVVPRAGARFTWYQQTCGDAAPTSEIYRGVFNTGMEVTTKASRVWAGTRNGLFDVTGIRHIFEPYANYAYVPNPNYGADRLPQYDYEMASIRPLPIEFPDYTAIDTIGSQNILRFGMRNRLQTKRERGADNLVSWDIFADWNLTPDRSQGQDTFGDAYSILSFRPRSWLAIESENRFDCTRGDFKLARESLLIEPNNVWNWVLSYYYLREDLSPTPTAWGYGANAINSIFYVRFNEDWGLRASHYYDVDSGRLAEQSYSLYRDLRSWTAAVILRVRDIGNGEHDVTAGVTFSLKAFPRYKMGSDSIRQYGLLGY